MNHTRFPKENHLPEWERRDNKIKKGDRAEDLRGTFKTITGSILLITRNFSDKSFKKIKTQSLCSIPTPPPTPKEKSCCWRDNVGKYGPARQTGHSLQFTGTRALHAR